MSKRVMMTMILWLAAWSLAVAEERGINLEGYAYPFPVKFHALPAPSGSLKMAYMDIQPTSTPNGRTVVLLHGKNFNGAYWQATAQELAGAGYRVVIPDQIGFGKSSKPETYSYTFAQLVSNTRGLLQTLGAERVTVVAHSMGGMMALHWALLAPSDMERLVLINPIGLEDWTAKGVPYRGLAGWYDRELKTTPESIETYQKSFYYDGQWKPEFARWAEPLAAPIGSPDYPRLALVQAQTAAMIVSQPVAHRFAEIRVPTRLIIGERDRTALDKDLAPAEVAAGLGRYDLLGPQVAGKIPGARLFALPGLGHLPQVEDFPRFVTALRDALAD